MRWLPVTSGRSGSGFRLAGVTGLVVALVASAAIFVAGPSLANTTAFTEFPLGSGALPVGVVTGFDAVWYTDNSPNDKIGKVDLETGALLAEFSSPVPGIHGAIATGPKKVWFAPETVTGTGGTGADPQEVIFSLDPTTGAIATFPLPMDAGPSRLATGFGFVWYTGIPRNVIGRLDPTTGDVVEFPIPTPNSIPVGITTGLGFVWFAELVGNVGRLDPDTGVITEFPVSKASDVVTAFDAVWFVGGNADLVGKLDPGTGLVTEYPLAGGSLAFEIDAGPRFVWFAEIVGNKIGRIDPATGVITEFVVPTADSRPFGIAHGSDIWFAENSTAAPKIGRLHADRFSDDDTSVFELDIEWLAEQGITRGCNPPTNDRYCPGSSVTRGQMAAFLVRALGLTDRLDNPFSDDDGSIFEADIERLAAAGITRGCNPPTNDRFCPDSKVTRGAMAAFLVRALGLTDDGGGNLFVDDDGSIFESDIDKLGTAGVTRGCNPPTNDRFCPGSAVTRGQMAAFLRRALG